MEERRSTGPYVIDTKGKKGDREFWKASMDPIIESKFDKYMQIISIGRAAKTELNRRKTDNA